MRILHTADWHLGRSFHRVGLDEIQRQALQEILDIIDTHQVEVLIVAGDIYDRAVPSAAAINNYNWMIEQLVRRKIITIMSSGNHDSAERLGVARAATAAGGIHLITSVDQLEHPVELQLTGAVAPLNVYAIPYLDPRAYSGLLQTDTSHQAVIEEATKRIKAHLSACRVTKPQTQALCVAHLFAQGGTASESEKPIVVGGIETVSADVFDDFSYTALGHLHRPQKVAGQENIRYSGSLTKFSFSEVNNTNQVVLLDYRLDEDGAPQLQGIQTMPLQAQLPMAQLQGDFATLTQPDWLPRYRDHYLQIKLIDDEPPTDAYRQLLQHYPQMVEYQREWLTPKKETQESYRTQFARVSSDEELCEMFYQHATGRQYQPEIAALFNAAIEQSRVVKE